MLVKKSRFLSWTLAALSFCALGGPLQAANLTWDNGAATGNWNTTDANFTGLWTNGNTAVFGSAPASTVTINAAGISAAGVTFNTTGYTVAASGANTLTLSGGNIITVGSGLTDTISAPLAGTAGVQVEGGGTLNLTGISTIDGGGTGTLGLVVGQTSANNSVSLSSGGTMGTITANRRVLTIGGSTFGGNSVTISTPGNSGTPTFNASGNGTQPSIGVSSSSNSLLVNNGAYVAQTNGGGTNTWTMGTNAGANSNTITVTGAGSSIVFGSNQAMVVGAAGGASGAGNSVTISAGGLFNTRRFQIGSNGGDFNSVVITGANSLATTNVNSTNSLFEIGTIAGSNNNFMSIAAGGTYTFLGSGNSRNFSIGRAGDNNYLEVTGSNSLLTVSWNQSGANSNTIPYSVGGFVSSTATVTDGGTGNHLDISNNGTITSDVSLYVMGTNSNVNLGDGSGISTLTVGATANVGTNTSAFTPGVFLKNASGALNFNGGKLIAGANGALISGPGSVNLNGAAEIFTAQSASVVSSTITGGGGNDLTKTGSGKLSLTVGNSYLGSTNVNAGTLLASNASGSATGSGAVNVNNTGTFGGTGAVTGAVNVNSGGTLSPGASLESLATGALSFGGGSTYLYELTTASLDGDLTDATGTLSIAGSPTLTLTDLGASTALLPGSKLTLISYSGTWNGGTFGGYADDSTFTLGLNNWLINYNDTTGGSNFGGGSGANFVTISIAPVPEPSSFALLGLGCLFLGGNWIRRKRKAA